MSALTSIISGGAAAKAAKKQAKQLRIKEAAEREANRVDKKKNALKTQKQKISLLREARIKRARIVQQTANAGAKLGGTSSATGATGSIASQLGQNIGMLQQFEGFGDRLSALSQQSADALSKYNRIGAKQAAFAGMMSAIGGAGDAAIAAVGGMSSIGGATAGGNGAWGGASGVQSGFGPTQIPTGGA